MRVAIFTETYFPFISGVVTHIQTLKEELEANGHQVLIVTLNPKAKRHYVQDGILYCPAVPLKRIYGYGVANPVNLRRLAILRQFNPDIIHLHTEFTMGIFALFAAKQLRKPVVYTLHTMYDDYVFYLFPSEKVSDAAKPAAHAYIRKVASTTTQIIGPSRKVADYLVRCGVNKYVNIIPNAVDLSAFQSENVEKEAITAAKEKLGIQKNDVAICFVGRLGKEKSIDVLIDYFAHGFAGKPEFKLFIIGAGPEQHDFQQQINRLNIGNQVKLLGRIDHDKLPAYYQACDLFATASLSEMNSISMLEATASGLYVVQRLDELNRDQIESGQNGDVFSTPKEFTAIVQEYADLSPQKRQERKKSVEAYSKRYGPKEFIASVLGIYEKAIKEYHNPSRRKRFR